MGKYKIFILILIIAITGGGTGVFFKIALREIPPDLLTLLRFVFAFIVLLPFFLKENNLIVPNRTRLILISLFATINVIFFLIGLQYTTASIASMLYAAVPFVAGIFAWKIIREEIGFYKWLGIVIGFIGTLVIVIGPKLGTASAASGSLLGNLILLFSICAFSLYSVLSKKYENVYSPIILTKYFILTTIIVQFIFMLLHLGESFNLLQSISLTAWLSVLYTGVLGTALFYLLYQYIVKRASPVLASMVFYLQPISAVIWAYLVINEKITSIFVLGSLLIFLGLALVFNEKYFNRSKVNT